MKKCIVLFLSICFVANLSAQLVGNNVKFYSNEGELFSLFINGRKINATPADQVEINKVFVNSLNVKVVFEANPTDTIAQKQLPITNAGVDDMPCPYNTIYKIEKPKKGKKADRDKYAFVLKKMECMYETPKRYEPDKK